MPGRVGTLIPLFLIIAATGYAQDQPSYGRLIITETSRWGNSVSGVVRNFGPGKMCAVVVQATTFAEDNPSSGDYGKTSVVTHQIGDLDRDQDAHFNLGSAIVKGRMPGIYATGVPCR